MLRTEYYHVHVYYELNQFALASAVRDKLKLEVPEIMGVGPLRKTAVGPHPIPMFEAWFSYEVLDSVMTWMKKNNSGLSVMFHPLTGNDLEDHELHLEWIGPPLKLNLEVFK
jgi:aromatic ring-cleaving dioxygenase